MRDWKVEVAAQMAGVIEDWQRDAVRIGLPDAARLLDAARLDVLDYLTKRQAEPPVARTEGLTDYTGSGPHAFHRVGANTRRDSPKGMGSVTVIPLEAFRGA